MALLTAGQFDHAFKELKSWMDSVTATLEEVEPIYGDPKLVEIENAKLKVRVKLLELRLEQLTSFTCIF